MTSSKDVIMSRLRTALAQSQPADADPQIIRPYQQEGALPPGDDGVIAQFVEALEDYNAKVKVVPTGADVPAAIDEFLAGDNVTSVVVPAGLPDEWAEGVSGAVAKGAATRNVTVDSVDEPASKEALDEIEGVVTASRAAVSMSGTIMLDGEPDQGRRIISLLPDVHVCVVRASDVFPTMPQAIALLGQHPERPQTWLAGGSATSDIELVRVDGVHGPRHLRVVIVKDQ